MYKPGTKLIITDLWAAAAAHKLGFEVESKTFSSNYWQKMFIAQSRFCQWRITVTESGPNAAERFLPQVDDYVEWAHCHPRIVCADDLHPQSEALIPLSFARMYAPQKGVRILERNGIPFPQFSDVIEP